MLLNKKNKTDNASEYVANEGRTDYVVKKNRRADIIAYLFSLVAAIILWGYVMTSGGGGVTKVVFNSVDLTYRGENELRDKYGLIVQDVNESLSVTVSGDKDDLKNIDRTGINVYIDLSDITSAGEYTRRVDAEVPGGLKYELSAKEVTVVIDKPTSREISVNSENVRIKGTQLVDYPIVDKSLNISKVTLEGSSVNLDKVASIEIITDAVGQITSSMKVSANIVLLDEELNELDLPITVKTDTGRDGVIVSLTVFRRKTVKLTVNTTNNYFGSDQIKIEPAEIEIRGEASIVNSISSVPLDIETINEKNVFADNTYTGLGIKTVEGVTYSNTDGSTFYGATLTITVSELETCILSVSNFELLGAPDGVQIADRRLLITVRAIPGENAAMMLRSLEEHPDKVTLRVDYQNIDSDGRAPVVVFFSEEYRSYVYEVGSYTVSLTKSAD